MSLTIRADQSSQWMPEFHKQLVRGKHVLLYGNVGDQFLLNGAYVSLHNFLDRYFREEGYQLIGRYDIVDGLQLAERPMQALFERIVSTARGGAVVAPPPPLTGPTSPVIPAGSPPARAVPRAGAARGGPQLIQPDQALDAIRVALSQREVPSAFYLDFSDKLVTAPDRQSEGELRLVVLARKIMQQAEWLNVDPLRGRRNSLIIIASQLGALPPWLYHENPLLSLVQVGRPRWEERHNFIQAFLKDFWGANALVGTAAKEVVRDFADLTEGLTAWDLEMIRRTSIVEQMPIVRARQLIDYYKYGQRDDPWERLDPGKIRDARRQIESRVIGQPVAVEAVVSMLVAARVGVSLAEPTSRTGRPKGTFFFVGPTGVGKTELAKALTALIFGDEAAFARFDMSEYAEQHAAEKLTGSPPGYVGYEEGGQLTNRVRERPFSLLLFDEIEKAHGRVMDKFLQILEDGRLTDGKGQTAYFSQSVIIFTSNIGSDTLQLTQDGQPGEHRDYEKVREHYLAHVRDHFTQKLGRPELLNRLGDNILVFDLLRPEYIAGICEKFLAALVISARERRNLELTFPGEQVVGLIRDRMLFGENLLFGGRRIKTLLEAFVERPLNRWIFFNNPPHGSRVEIGVDSGGVGIVINGQSVS